MIPLPHKLPGDVIQLVVVLIVLDKETVHNHILSAVIQDAFCRLSVTSGTACLLVIGFHIFRHVVMDDIADI